MDGDWRRATGGGGSGAGGGAFGAAALAWARRGLRKVMDGSAGF